MCFGDVTPPAFRSCPSDMIIDLSASDDCDTTLFWPIPTVEDDCEILDFTEFFDESEWELRFSGPGGGSFGSAIFNASDDTLTIMGSTGGVALQNTNTDLCITVDRAGAIGFNWEAEAIGGGAQLVNDEPAFVVNGNQTILATGPGNMALGTVLSYDLEAGDEFCFRVRSNNIAALTTMIITEFWFTPAVELAQVSGPRPDTLPTMMGGDTLTAGRYVVTYEATDATGNSSSCSFNIIVFGADDLACEDINVSLDENCGVRVLPSMVLTETYACVDAFEVELFQHGVSIGDSVDLTYLGQTLDYVVTDPGSLNSCWGTILVEDKFDPELICEDDTVNCVEFRFQVDTPDVIEFCQAYEIRMVEEIITPRDCDQEFVKFAIRKWIAIDESNNVSDTCPQSLWISRFPMAEVMGPVMDTTVYCGSGYAQTTAGRPGPSATGVPVWDTIPLFPLPDFFCNVTVEYEDFPLSETACTQRFVRQWKVTEWWCNMDSTRNFDQIITVVDTVGPAVSLFQDTITAKAGRRSCDAQVHLPAISTNDVCNDVDRVDMVYPGGFSGDQNGGLVRLPVGTNAVVYRVFDECYNMTTDTLIVVVDDGAAPVAICDQNTAVSLNQFGQAELRAEVLDDGSFDECELDRVEVRRMDITCATSDTLWGPTVSFCCADVNTDVMVALRAVDKSGNENICMVMVNVQDKTPPAVQGLPTIIVDCRFDWDTANLDVFGKFVFDPADQDSIKIDADSVRFIGSPLDGIIVDNCPPVMEEEVDMSSLNQCGIGFIVRLFTFIDGQGNQSTWSQSIFFEDFDPFTEDQINWPNHLDTTDVCGVANFRPEMLSDSFAFPIFIDEDECSLVGYDYKDEVHDASQGNEACFRIIRSWTVIDWCQTENGIHKKWTFDQVIDVSNTVAPTILNDCRDTVRCTVSPTCTPDTFQLIGVANDDCTDSIDLFWRIKIDEFSDGTIDHVILSNDATGAYPFGVHKAKYIVEDLCGNQDSCEFTFEIRNCKPPTAYCRAGLVAELTPIDTNGMLPFDIEEATINARDFDDGSSHVCGHELAFSFSSDTTDTLRVYNCDSLVPPFRNVTVWVTDKVTGETSQCVNFVEVQDNNMEDVCGSMSTGTVSGILTTNNDKMIDEAEVYLNNMGGRMSMSNKQGEYAFTTLPLGTQFVIEPYKNNDITNGVSTADLVTIQRHLLGKNVFQEPELYIAADVNNSEGVTSADIAALRKVILGIKPEFEHNTSWRFVDKSYQFPNPINPWEEEFPEEYNVNLFERDMNVNFNGIKIGDVTGDVEVGAINGANKTRSAVEVNIANRSFKAGEIIEIPLYLEWIESVSGFQYTLEWDPSVLEFIQIQPNYGIDMDLNNFALDWVDQGQLSSSWHTTSTLKLPSEKLKTMGKLKFMCRKSGDIAGLLHFTSAITKNEIYFKNDESSARLQLAFDGESQAGYFALYQNIPNPWSEFTNIAFNLIEDENVQLTIYDEHGRMVKKYSHSGQYGHNSIQVSQDELSAGVYYYRLDTQKHTATKKMIIM